MSLDQFRQGDKAYLYASELAGEDVAKLFEPAPTQCTTDREHAGRAPAHFFHWHNDEWVLKRYLRGGMVQKIARESYLFTGLEHTRMWRELRLLQRMRALALPVPMPLAAMCQVRLALTYRGAIITQRIADAETLAERARDHTLPGETWRRVGATIAEFHRQQVYHADLNAHNIMIDSSDRVFLIDFDKGAFRPGEADGWRLGNLERLHRSLTKLTQTGLNFTAGDWRRLRSGYEHATS